MTKERFSKLSICMVSISHCQGISKITFILIEEKKFDSENLQQEFAQGTKEECSYQLILVTFREGFFLGIKGIAHGHHGCILLMDIKLFSIL